jgi:LuxR family maltose regulon positive regulatory protein
LVEIDTLRALARHATGDDSGAFEALTLALRRAENSGYLRTLADEGAPLARLLRNWLTHRAPDSPAVSITYLGDLYDALGIEMPLPRKRRAYGTPQTLPEPLSDRELDILRLVALGRSNREIAAQLFITTGTVKRHIHNIFRKLGARNRVEAGLRGRELGLI